MKSFEPLRVVTWGSENPHNEGREIKRDSPILLKPQREINGEHDCRDKLNNKIVL